MLYGRHSPKASIINGSLRTVDLGRCKSNEWNCIQYILTYLKSSKETRPSRSRSILLNVISMRSCKLFTHFKITLDVNSFFLDTLISITIILTGPLPRNSCQWMQFMEKTRSFKKSYERNLIRVAFKNRKNVWIFSTPLGPPLPLNCGNFPENLWSKTGKKC